MDSGPKRIGEIWHVLGFKKAVGYFLLISGFFWLFHILAVIGVYNANLFTMTLPIFMFILIIQKYQKLSLKEIASRIGFTGGTSSGRRIVMISLIVFLFFMLLSINLFIWGNQQTQSFKNEFEPVTKLAEQTWASIINIALQLIFVALFEELTFRVIVLSFLLYLFEERWGVIGRHLSFALSGFLFFLPHPTCIRLFFGFILGNANLTTIFWQNIFIADGLNKLVMGYILAYIYYSSGNIMFPMLIHACANVYLSYFSQLTNKIAEMRANQVVQNCNNALANLSHDLQVNCNDFCNNNLKSSLDNCNSFCQDLIANITQNNSLK